MGSNIPAFVAIESDVLLDKSLTNTDKIVYGVIGALSNNKYCACYATNEYICQLVNVEKRQLKYCLKNLKKYNYIIVEITKNKRLIKPTVNRFLQERRHSNNNTNDDVFYYDWLNN